MKKQRKERKGKKAFLSLSTGMLSLSFSRYEPSRRRRSSGTGLLSISWVKTKHGEAAFSFHAPPRNLQVCSTFTSFIMGFKTFLFVFAIFLLNWLLYFLFITRTVRNWTVNFTLLKCYYSYSKPFLYLDYELSPFYQSLALSLLQCYMMFILKIMIHRE